MPFRRLPDACKHTIRSSCDIDNAHSIGLHVKFFTVNLNQTKRWKHKNVWYSHTLMHQNHKAYHPFNWYFLDFVLESCCFGVVHLLHEFELNYSPKKIVEFTWNLNDLNSEKLHHEDACTINYCTQSVSKGTHCFLSRLTFLSSCFT